MSLINVAMHEEITNISSQIYFYKNSTYFYNQSVFQVKIINCRVPNLPLYRFEPNYCVKFLDKSFKNLGLPVSSRNYRIKMPIIFDETGMVEQVKLNPETTIGKEICASHVVKVWEAVNAFIVQTLCGGRGVRIPGLMTITFKVIQIELSARDTILQKNPHIILSGEVALRHSLKVKKPPYNLDIPEVDLNLSVIAKICNMSRVHVEHCIEEIIHAYNRALATDPHVELWLTKIGRVIVEAADVDVVFCSEFLNLLGYSEEFVQDKRCPIR